MCTFENERVLDSLFNFQIFDEFQADDKRRYKIPKLREKQIYLCF